MNTLVYASYLLQEIVPATDKSFSNAAKHQQPIGTMQRDNT